MRINRYLATCEVASRRKSEELVRNGKVKINGAVVRNLATQVSDDDFVTVNGKPVNAFQTPIYIILNKPQKFITAVEDNRNRKTVIDVLNSSPSQKSQPVTARVFPIGRLDYDTEGLLLLTNDGTFAESVTHPKEHVGKTYHATLDKQFDTRDIPKLCGGVMIDGEMTLPARAKVIQNAREKSIVELTIFQGRNRQVRKMFESLGYAVTNLKRTAIGKLALGNLRTGEYKLLHTPPRI